MPIQPSNPEPAHASTDSMLARKFGKEVANYFSGSPLNRVAFLRGDHTFLSQALHHPSTKYLPVQELQPLVEKETAPGQGRIAWVKYEDVKPIIGEDPFVQSEQEQIERFDSGKYVPQMIFLGIEETKKGGGEGGVEGLSYTTKKNTYTGVPHFAVDVTPKESVKEACEKLIKDQESRGRSFAKGRVMDVVAADGTPPHTSPTQPTQPTQPHPTTNNFATQRPLTPKPANSSTGMPATPTAPAAATARSPSTQASNAPARPATPQPQPPNAPPASRARGSPTSPSRAQIPQSSWPS